LDFLGLDSWWQKISIIADFPEMFLSAFEIPSDSDDTGCGLALGLKLKNSPFSAIYNTWALKNSDLATSMSSYKKFSYKPFSTDINENLIDPRTYYWLRGFLEEQAAQKNTGLALITTWFQNMELCQKQAPAVRMPFDVNNVDASVIANALFGIFFASDFPPLFPTILLSPYLPSSLFLPSSSPTPLLPLSHRPHLVHTHLGMTSTLLEGGNLSWFDSEVQSLYQDSANLLSWILRNNTLANRPDLVLVYYPPIYDFYWFTARLSFLLNNPPHALPFPVLVKTRDMLQKLLESYGTDQLLAKIKTCDATGACWDDFLGNADSPPSYSDRLFSTSIALNALIDTWTTATPGRRVLKPGIPSVVLSAIKKGVTWLDSWVLNGKYSPENVFFSGSMKSPSFSLPFSYPSNFHMWLNGTPASCSYNVTFNSDNLISAISGYVQPAEYEKLLHAKCFNQALPTQYPGMNCPDCYFPYWSAPALTYAAAMGALSKFISLGI
jgi:hypothetical protein